MYFFKIIKTYLLIYAAFRLFKRSYRLIFTINQIRKYKDIRDDGSPKL